MPADVISPAIDTATTCRRVVDELPRIDPAARDRFLAGAAERAHHATIYERCKVLHSIERSAPRDPARTAGSELRVAFWNAERCKHGAESAAMLAAVDAEAILLCEMDLGMARSGQRHTTRDLAERLEHGYLFATEFVELGLGDARERLRYSGQSNRCGLHGAAIVSPLMLQQPALLRLPSSGEWYDGSRGERRVGGRVALAAKVALAGDLVVVVSVHLESHSDPAFRVREMAALLSALERYCDDAPVIMGGDFNTRGAGRDQVHDPALLASLLAADPDRFRNPVRHEPMFELLARAGFDWIACNAPGITTRDRPGYPPAPIHGRLDWFFTRGLQASRPANVPAVRTHDGAAISDHDAICVTISRADSR